LLSVVTPFSIFSYIYNVRLNDLLMKGDNVWVC
jgi:hypothetical protein